MSNTEKIVTEINKRLSATETGGILGNLKDRRLILPNQTMKLYRLIEFCKLLSDNIAQPEFDINGAKKVQNLIFNLDRVYAWKYMDGYMLNHTISQEFSDLIDEIHGIAVMIRPIYFNQWINLSDMRTIQQISQMTKDWKLAKFSELLSGSQKTELENIINAKSRVSEVWTNQELVYGK